MDRLGPKCNLNIVTSYRVKSSDCGMSPIGFILTFILVPIYLILFGYVYAMVPLILIFAPFYALDYLFVPTKYVKGTHYAR